MKLLTTIILCLAAPFYFLDIVHAAPSNGTRIPAKGRVELGYEYSMIYKRPLDNSYGNLKSECNFYTATFGAFDWLALDGKIGMGNVTQKGGVHLPKIEYDTGFAGGYGFRIKAFTYRPWDLRMILGAEHISVHPQLRSVNDEKYTSFLDDWQVSWLVAKDLKHLTVYTGIKGSDCEIVYKINGNDKRRRFSKDHLGLIAGLEAYLFKDNARIGAEGRFFDETAFSASVSYLF